MNELPIKIKTYVTAVQEAMEISLHRDDIIYLFRINEGGYVIDNQAEIYSNEKLIVSLYHGKA